MSAALHILAFLGGWTAVSIPALLSCAWVFGKLNTPDPFAGCADPLSFAGLDQ